MGYNDVTTPTSSSVTTTLCFPDLVNYKDKDLCNGCDRAIVDTIPFYKCTYGCDFVLHEWCTRFPRKLKGCLVHPLDTLLLLPKADDRPVMFFHCQTCSDTSSRFLYYCARCLIHIGLSCAFIPKKITHKSHPYHLLSGVQKRFDKDYCRICLSHFTSEKETSFSCNVCHFHLHPACALLFPETISHRYDKHPMVLRYGPTKNHEGDYFCEVCEEELNPNTSFYHCQECTQSVHLACAPVTPHAQSKAYMYRLFRKMFMIMKI